jgi:hypothetical protein
MNRLDVIFRDRRTTARFLDSVWELGRKSLGLTDNQLVAVIRYEVWKQGDNDQFHSASEAATEALLRFASRALDNADIPDRTDILQKSRAICEMLYPRSYAAEESSG